MPKQEIDNKKMDLSKYQAEAAKSNRAQCRETSCKQNIGKGELRLGHQSSDFYSWYHAACAFKTFDNRYIRNTRITSVDQIQYFDQLSEEHQTTLRQLIDGTYVAPPESRNNPRPKRGVAATVEVEDTKEETPAATSSSSQSNSNTTTTAKKRSKKQ